MADAGDTSRTEIGRQVCARFGFLDAHGKPQVASCMQALRALAAARQIDLPPPVGLPARVNRVRDLQLVAVRDEHQRRVWNLLIAREHPRGAVLHAGAQLHYLLVSEHGVLGALGFAAAALTLAVRDAFIGWDPATRSRHLHRVLGLSRFLIRPSAPSRNLVSKALSLALRRLPYTTACGFPENSTGDVLCGNTPRMLAIRQPSNRRRFKRAR